MLYNELEAEPRRLEDHCIALALGWIAFADAER
jgi:hypothetical protein